MCGIYGITEKNPQWVKTYIDKCQYRGPDMNQIYVDDNVTLGHNLLSITDTPSQGIQPWKTNKGNILIYNGEIFNYIELCKKYKNFEPKTTCDTELLAWGLDEFGIDFIDQIDSQHAFALWIKDKKQLYLSRDHVGIKPLFYSLTNNFLVFGSEVRGLLDIVPSARNMDYLALSCWSLSGLNITNNSFFKGIKKLMPGETIKFDLNTKKLITVKRDIILGGNGSSYNQEEFRTIFSHTVNESLIGTRPIGIFLSGGLDSAMIAFHANKIFKQNTFTNHILPCPYDPEEDYNSDSDEAKKFAKLLSLNHKMVVHTPKLYAKFWKKTVEALEEPMYNPSLPMYAHMNEVMSKSGIVVTLAGDMGDEILGGYPSYIIAKRQNFKNYRDCVLFWLTKRLARPPSFKIKININEIVDILIETVFPDKLWDKDDPVSSYMRLDQQGICSEDYFRRNDRLGMLYSMEGRFPFACKKMMNYCMNIHSSHKFGDTMESLKKMSRNSYKGILPDSIINKSKTGWTAPINLWRTQFGKDCREINHMASQITNISLPNDKRWAPILHFFTWKNIFNMNYNFNNY